jgi:glutamate-1-semialdehyde 2,1-aminomutase
MRAGIETLKRLSTPGFYEALDRKGAQLADGIKAALSESGVAGQVARIGSLLTLFLTAEPVRNYTDARKSDTRKFAAFFQGMLQRGVLLAPSQFEAAFVSVAHTEEDIARTAAACRESVAALRAGTASA